MENSKNVTIYDIALKAGTSPSTVGSVMNGSWRSRRISEARAEEIRKLADEMGYSVNLHASSLRKERSKIIGMIVPMHDNRYFSSISQAFEEKARERGLFPIISSTLRDPKIEEEAVRLLLNYQVEKIICTGATDPDSIYELCAPRGVQTYNLDLPGSRAPSVISDNYAGARKLTEALIRKLGPDRPSDSELVFVGGRPNDHNTKERIRGFLDAAMASNIRVTDAHVMPCGYAASKAEQAIRSYHETHAKRPVGLFVNSTISLEGILNWFQASGLEHIDDYAFGCFDWDPFAAMINSNIIMVRQDVRAMVDRLFCLIDLDQTDTATSFIPPILLEVGGKRAPLP